MDNKQPVSFSFKADTVVGRIFWCLLGFELLIVFLDIFVNHYEWSSVGAIRRMVNITREDSLSNWFSSLQEIAVGSTVWLTAFAVRNQKEGSYYKRKFYCWAGIGLFFFYMGIDDAIKFHERVGTASKVLFFENDDNSGTGILGSIYGFFPSYTWQLVFGPFFVSVSVFMIWFFWKELYLRRQFFLFLVGVSLYAVAVVLDFVEGLDSGPYAEMGIAGFFSTTGSRIMHMSKALEEFLEMFGTTIFLTIFLKNLFRLSREWRLNIS